MTEPRYLRGAAALLIGCALNHLGDRLLGVKMELFFGLSTFSFAWMLDVFFLPFVVGVVVALIFGLGGKWLCYFPPLIVRVISYAEITYLTGVPQGSHLNPIGWWGFFVILAMEASAIGGVIGEFMIKGTYGSTRPPPETESQAAISADREV
jgi:hypothetical protein